MKILVVSATHIEVEPLINQLEIRRKDKLLSHYRFHEHEVDLLITGVGMTSTAFYLGKFLSKKYDLAINAGIAGAFNKSLHLGQVVNVHSDLFADLGAEAEEGFLSLAELNLLSPNQFPFESGVLVNPVHFSNSVASSLPAVNGITVNTVHGVEASIEKALQKYGADIETMEGAAFMFACLMEDVPCLQIRGISNYIEKRNKANWKIQEAIDTSCKVTLEILKSIHE